MFPPRRLTTLRNSKVVLGIEWHVIFNLLFRRDLKKIARFCQTGLTQMNPLINSVHMRLCPVCKPGAHLFVQRYHSGTASRCYGKNLIGHYLPTADQYKYIHNGATVDRVC